MPEVTLFLRFGAIVDNLFGVVTTPPPCGRRGLTFSTRSSSEDDRPKFPNVSKNQNFIVILGLSMKNALQRYNQA